LNDLRANANIHINDDYIFLLRKAVKKTIINTTSAPQAIGTYSQAIKVENTVYLSGQIPLDPDTMVLVEGGIEAQIHRVFKNLSAVAEAADGALADIVKLSVFLIDLNHFPLVNEIMSEYFQEPYPARVAIGVTQLPKEAIVEMDAIMIINS